MKQATFRNDFQISLGGCTRQYRIRYNEQTLRWDIYQTDPELNTAENDCYYRVFGHATTLGEAFQKVAQTF